MTERLPFLLAALGLVLSSTSLLLNGFDVIAGFGFGAAFMGLAMWVLR